VTSHIRRPSEREVIQIAPGHRWGGHFAVVDKVKTGHVVAFVLVRPPRGQKPLQVFMRLDWDEFDALGVEAPFVEEVA
jgi:hypothetical protein